MLEGEISQINLIERLVELWREQFTGAIRFENDGIIKIIYFKNGDVLSASTNDRADSIDEILMRAGKVSREHVKQALARRKESETLGDAMLNLGYITRKELTWARRVQVVGVIRSIAAWSEGSFTIVADYLPKRDEGTLFPLPQVLVELIVTETDRQKFDRALSGGEAVLVKSEEFDEVFRRLGLNEDAEAIVGHVDGIRNAADVASASGRDAFNVYKLLHALATLGILRDSGKPQVSPELFDEFASAGVADAADTWSEAAADGPAFQFDEEEAFAHPTLEVPRSSLNDDGPALTPVTSAWDEPDDEGVTQPAAKMPSWDSPPSPVVVPVPAPAALPVALPVRAEEPAWGFDEAQLETARRASAAAAPAALPQKAKVKEGGRFGLLIALMVIAILAGAGYFGWLWWKKQQEQGSGERVAATTPTTTTSASATRGADPGTIVPVDASGTAATSATASGNEPAPLTITQPATTTQGTATTSTAPATPTTTAAPAPMTITAPPEPLLALPVVRPRNGVRSRLDDMARQYAANPQGNFTVQIQILCDPANLEKLTRSGGDDLWFVPQTIGERACYRVFWGHYATRDEAQRGLASVPSSIRDRSAAVKSVPRP